ncbi:MAG: protein kinase, partial [Gemmatimonadetes bacterium]|nr:protein kinase [Gemmatimonadota bacterium]
MTDLRQRLESDLSARYRIEGELAEGGMAIVFRATDVKHDRSVAVKVLRPELSAMVGADRFLREIRVTAQLQHPHILPLYDSGAAGDLLYYVMPLINGESLRERLTRERQLPVAEAISLIGAIASALDYAHRQGILHRDIKPENILLHDRQPLLADFGIALAVSAAGGDRLTVTGLSVGTPSYMSPEQIAGDQALDARTDIYALGCVAY